MRRSDHSGVAGLMSCNAEDARHCSEGVAELMSCEDSLKKPRLRNP